MYETLKNELIDELVMSRELTIIRYKKPMLRSIFKISSLDDNLFREIIDKFDRISFKYAKKIIELLCQDHGIEYEFKRDNGYNIEGRSKFSYFFIDGQKIYFKLFPYLEIGGVQATDLKKQFYETGDKVLGVFTLQANDYNKDRVHKMGNHWKKSNPDLGLELLLYEEFI